jgi:hypothetical protein
MEATPTNSSNDETTTLLWRKKLLEDKDFHYDPFLSSLPRKFGVSSSLFSKTVI